MAQITSVDINVALLCERIGWRGPEGFERLLSTPGQSVRDWLVIAEMEREKEKKRGN
jgi:hypothetical protein